MDVRRNRSLIVVLSVALLLLLTTLYVVSYPTYLRMRFGSDAVSDSEVMDSINTFEEFVVESPSLFRPIEAVMERSQWANQVMTRLASLLGASNSLARVRTSRDFVSLDEDKQKLIRDVFPIFLEEARRKSGMRIHEIGAPFFWK